LLIVAYISIGVFVLTVNPLKISIALLRVSISASINIIWRRGSPWVTAVILLTFSSGIMILFCYSSSLVRLNRLNRQRNNVLFILARIFLMLFSLRNSWLAINSSMLEFRINHTTIFVALILISYIIPIIEKCFTPSNPMQSRF